MGVGDANGVSQRLHRWIAASAVVLGLGAAVVGGTATAYADGTTSTDSSSSTDTSGNASDSNTQSASAADAATAVKPDAGTSVADPGDNKVSSIENAPTSVVGDGRLAGSESQSSSATKADKPASSSNTAANSAFDVESVKDDTATPKSPAVADVVSTAPKARAQDADEPAAPDRRDASESSYAQPRQPPAAAAVTPSNTSTAAPAASSAVASSPAESPQYRLAATTPPAETSDAPAVTQPFSLSTPVAETRTTILAPIRDLVVSISNWLNQLPSNPITDLLQGAFLWLRRSFFDEPPTLTPVQTSGQDAGTIKGTFGGADPEREAISYRVVHEPLHGTVAATPDGQFTYTPGPDFDGSDVFTVAATDAGSNLNLATPWKPHTTYANVEIQQGADVHQLDFKFTYGTGAQYWSQKAKTELEYSAKVLSTYFVVTSPVTLDYAVIGANVRGTTAQGKPNCVGGVCSGTLASAISPLVSDDPGFYQTVVQKKVITGVDANGSAADGRVTFNFGTDWGFGNSITGDQYDFQSTAMHELLHTFGFADAFSKPGENTTQNWYTYDQFVTNATGAKVIDSTDYKFDTAYDANLTGRDGGLYFSGPNAVEAYGGRVPLFTPAEYTSSSVGHLDDNTFNSDDPDSINYKKMMNSADSEGLGIRTLSSVEIGILKDLGYTMVSAQTPTAPSV